MAEDEFKKRGEQDPEAEFEVAEGVPTLYCDSFHLSTGLWGATLYFGEYRPGKRPLLKARVKVSPQMLKAISLLSGKHVRDYVANVGSIELPAPLLEAWELEDRPT